MTQRKYALLLVCIILIGGFTKIILFLWVQALDPSRIFLPDSAGYINTAKAFLETGRFAVSPEMPDIPQIVRTPGYPFFLASIFYLFGATYPPLILTQILISIGTIIAVYHLATLLWDQRTGILSAVFLTLDVPSFTFSQYVLTETLFTFVLSLSIIAGIYALKQTNPVFLWILLHGLCLALATLIKPVAYYAILPVMTIFIIVWKTKFGWRWKTILIMFVTLVLPWIILVGGWKLRNYQVTGISGLSCIQGEHLLFYFGADIIAQRDGITFDEARYQKLGYGHYAEVYPETKNWSMAQLGQHWKQKGLSLIRQHPWFFLKAYIRGILKTMVVPGEYTLLTYIGNYQGDTGPIRDFLELPMKIFLQKWLIERPGNFTLFLITAVHLSILYIGSLFSLWHLIRNRNNWLGVHIFIWVIILYFIGLSGGYFRFRIPIMPLLAVYAGHGLYQIFLRFRNTSLNHR